MARNIQKSDLPTIHLGDGEDGRVGLDLAKLLGTRLLLQAMSGGGKSYLLRAILEQASEHLHTLVIDPEGEFASLREIRDMLLVGPEGEVPANPGTAAVLARRLVQLRVSAILDLSELKSPRDKHVFVREFLNGVMQVPKSMYHPMLVVIDEAHKLAPESGYGEACSTDAVVTLMDSGRKRGFCGGLATQRLSKLSKNAANEAANVFIGRTAPKDQDQAADLLGVPRKDKRLFSRLETGEFLAFGPAVVSDAVDVSRFRGAIARTTHPEAGNAAAFTPPAASSRIQGVLGELADLAAKADDEPATLEQAHQRIRTLTQELAKQTPAVDEQAIARAARAAKLETRQAMRPILASFEKSTASIADDAETLQRSIGSLRTLMDAEPAPVPAAAAPPAPAPRRAHTAAREVSASDLPAGEAAVLRAAIQYHPAGADRTQLTILTGYKRSSRDTYIQRLRSKGMVDAEAGGPVRATEAGLAAMPDAEPLPTGEALQQYWHDRLPEGERRIFDHLVEAGGAAVHRDQISEATGYKRSSRDTYIQRLAARHLVDRSGGNVSAAAVLFE